jgi:small conductance mechanosensitive channel
MDITSLDYKTLLYSPFFSNIIISIILLLVGITIGKIISRIIKRVLHELELDSTIKKAKKIKISLENSISNFFAYIIYFITIIIVLGELGVSTTSLNITIASLLLIVVIVAFFILNYFLPNIIAGVFLKRKDFIKKDDNIKFGDKSGKVLRINIIETLVRTKEGDIIYVPNSVLAKKEITIKGGKHGKN